MAFDRFDFEQRLLDCWNITSDLKTLSEGVLERNMTKDEIANIVIGLEQLYNLKFDMLFHKFEEMIKEQRNQSSEYDEFRSSSDSL